MGTEPGVVSLAVWRAARAWTYQVSAYPPTLNLIHLYSKLAATCFFLLLVRRQYLRPVTLLKASADASVFM